MSNFFNHALGFSLSAAPKNVGSRAVSFVHVEDYFLRRVSKSSFIAAMLSMSVSLISSSGL